MYRTAAIALALLSSSAAGSIRWNATPPASGPVYRFEESGVTKAAIYTGGQVCPGSFTTATLPTTCVNGSIVNDTTTQELKQCRSNAWVAIGTANVTASEGLTKVGSDVRCYTASAAQKGCLSATDYTAFFNKPNTVTLATEATTDSDTFGDFGLGDWAVDRDGYLNLLCWFVVLGTSSSAPQFKLVESDAETVEGVFLYETYPSAADEYTSNNAAVLTESPACTTSCLATAAVWRLTWMVRNVSEESAGVRIYWASSTANETVTVHPGSFCLWMGPATYTPPE